MAKRTYATPVEAEQYRARARDLVGSADGVLVSRVGRVALSTRACDDTVEGAWVPAFVFVEAE
jgi:hypothetical protein